MHLTLQQQESKVSHAFSRQSASFDDIYENNPITLLMRDKTRAEVLRHIAPGASMLELNCGTGIDTIFFASQGYTIHATDNAAGMLQRLGDKIAGEDYEDKITFQRCSFNDLSPLAGRRFDYLFSNFAGLNCTHDLASVLRDTGRLLNVGGYLTFVVMPKVCPWELVMLLRGRVGLALRRFRNGGASANIEGVHFSCYYYNVSYVRRALGAGFKLCSLKGLASFIPPPSMEYFLWKYPKTFSALTQIEARVCDSFPFNRWCDQYVITMQKTAE